MKEIWKDIPGFEGYYQASNLGQIRRVKRGNERGSAFISGGYNKLKGSINRHGYREAKLCKDGKKHAVLWHRAIMFAFHSHSLLHVNHKDGIKLNNKLANLEYVTPSENILHAKKLGLLRKGEDINTCKLTKDCVLLIRSMLGEGVFWQREIAALFGVNQRTISAIKLRKNWDYLK